MKKIFMFGIIAILIFGGLFLVSAKSNTLNKKDYKIDFENTFSNNLDWNFYFKYFETNNLSKDYSGIPFLILKNKNDENKKVLILGDNTINFLRGNFE